MSRAAGFAATNAAVAKTNAVTTTASVLPKPAPIATNLPVSVFIDVIGQGRDPFFPTSNRRAKMAAPVAEEKKPVNSKLAESLYLEGMITGKNPIVIINNTVIQANKSLPQTVKVGEENITIRFVEFKKKSVILEIGANKERKEVRFRDGQ